MSLVIIKMISSFIDLLIIDRAFSIMKPQEKS